MKQDTFTSDLWGEVQFFPVSGKAVNTKCKHCILLRTEQDCLDAPCTPHEREDGQDGYYSVHQMPKENKDKL